MGIATAMIGGAQGLCFAVSSNTAIFVLGEFLAHGRVRRAHLGIEAQTVAIARRIAVAAGIGATGVRIGAVLSDGPAEAAGLKSGDIIVAIDEDPVAATDDLLRKLDSSRIGRPLRLAIWRFGSIQNVDVVSFGAAAAWTINAI